MAFVEFKNNRFAVNQLITHLSRFFSESFTVSALSAVEQLLMAAVSEHMVDPAPGPRGGDGYKLNPAGAAFVSEVELPREIFDRRAELDGERNAEAKANPGPAFVNLLQVIRKDK